MLEIQIKLGELNAAKAKYDEVYNDLHAMLQPLTSKQISNLNKMSDGRLPFALKAYDFAKQIPELMPAFENIEEFKLHLDLSQLLRQIEIESSILTKNLISTRMLIGSYAYETALKVYEMSKMAAKKNIPGAKEAEEELSILFARNGNHDDSDENQDSEDLDKDLKNK